ncbi:MAG: PorP/SprF family type IX secretion system membrane protein [Saprospiraceae bacterium]|nr:PorP/SprF family type IX secretion system membrane protein [Bacteroidia bacterium]NNE14877.1 PorP/SprF family type IX secretion system membrane protein [Saprospiraceae bacterium]NNL90808.1 PorP/SprF family type IX secretion system membrane protein [Saprospiraceae bacterium]
MNIKQSFLAILCFLSISMSAQDAHFSYYQFAPSTVSPALTGSFYGNIRATIIRRSQWFNIGSNGNDGFNTMNVLLDGNIPFGLKEGDWISFGINMLSENTGLIAEPTAGILDMRRGFAGLSGAYHLTLGKKQTKVLTIAAKYGKYSNGYNGNGVSLSPSNIVNGQMASFEDVDEMDLKIGQNQDGEVIEDTNDIHLGFMYTTPMGKSSDLRIGISSDHLFAPRLNSQLDTLTGQQVGAKIDRRINGFIQLYTDLNPRLVFNPTLLYQKMGAASNLLLQGLFSYQHNKKKEIYLNFGLGVRVASNMDVPIYLGADYKDWRVGLSFDLNLTGLSGATSNAGAFELGISKIFKWNKKAEVKPKLICPRL